MPAKLPNDLILKMNLQMPHELGSTYKSSCQRVRVISEAWAERELFCAECECDRLTRTPPSTKCVDLFCKRCGSNFQLKAGVGKIPQLIPDGAYATMVAAIREGKAPNLLLLRYDVKFLTVHTLILIPKFAFPESAIVKRRPLGPNARRAGWIGCNISINAIPQDARIALIESGVARDATSVRVDLGKLQGFKQLATQERGWALEVLNCIRRRKLDKFTTADAYEFTVELQRLHPNNRNVEAKIRQQLQVLREAGFLIHERRGEWSLNPSSTNNP